VAEVSSSAVEGLPVMGPPHLAEAEGRQEEEACFREEEAFRRLVAADYLPPVEEACFRFAAAESAVLLRARATEKTVVSSTHPEKATTDPYQSEKGVSDSC
jgi:hypothetical protein